MVDINNVKHNEPPVYDRLELLTSKPTTYRHRKDLFNYDEFFTDSDVLPSGEVMPLALNDTMQHVSGIVKSPMDLLQVGIDMKHAHALEENEFPVTSFNHMEVNSSAWSSLQDRDKQFEGSSLLWHIPLAMDRLELGNNF